MLVVGVAAEGATEFNGKWGNMKVQEPLVGSIQGSTGPQGGRHEGEPASVGLKGRRVRFEQPCDAILAMFQDGGDNKGSTATEGEFTDGVSGSVALDFDHAGDNISDFVGDKVPV